MSKIFRQVLVTERLPKKAGYYWTNKGEQTLFTNKKHAERWCGGVIKEPSFAKVTGLGGLEILKVKYWMEEVKIPSSRKIKEKTHFHPSSFSPYRSWGARLMLRYIKGDSTYFGE